MPKPTSDFLSEDIAKHLDERTLTILAEAESFQEWDREQQLTLAKVQRDDAVRILAWLNAVFAAGNAKYGDRWSAGISIIQAHSHLNSDDESAAAEKIRSLHDTFDTVTLSVRSAVADDDSLDPVYEADLMAGVRITTRALFDSIRSPSKSTDEIVQDAIKAVRQQLLG